MTYKFYKNGCQFTAVNSEKGFIQFKTLTIFHSITFGVNDAICQDAILNDEEIDSDLFFDSLDYPVALLHNAIQFFKSQDPDYK